jgi:exosortase
MSPMWILHGQNLWLQPQYQVFPLLYLVFCGLAYREVRFVGEPPSARRRLAIGILAAAGIIFAASVLLFSPYLGQVAGILWLVGGLTRYASTVTIRRIAAYGCLLALTIIPPEISLQLSQSLQRITSVAASGAMETFRVPHIRFGNVIEVAGRALFVDEACSGIQSLFAALCVVVIIAVVQRLPFVLSALSLASVPCWALTGNLVRIVAISATHTWLKWDLTQGWSHELLGYLNFGLIAALLYLWIKLLATLLEPIPLIADAHPPAIELFNRCVQWPGERIDLSVPYADVPDGVGGASPEQPSRVVDLSRASRAGEIVRPAVWAAVAVSVVRGILNVAFIASRHQLVAAATGTAFDYSVRESLPGERAFAAVETVWPVLNYHVEERQTGSIFGHFSHIWHARPPRNFSCVASLDFPFLSYHDLSVCYRGSGWEVIGQRLIGLDSEGRLLLEEGKHGEFFELDLHRPAGGTSGFVVFGLMDQHGRVAEPPRPMSLSARIIQHLRRGPLPLVWPGFRGEGERGSALLQFQVFCEKTSPFSDEDRDLVRRQFAAALPPILRQSAMAFRAGKQPP